MWGWVLAAAALTVATLILASAARHPILARMALRNARRRPRQTATVIAGLMVGTAIVSAALVAGDSAGYAIRGYVYQSMGAIDESLTIPGYPFFSDEAYHAFDEHPAYDGVTAFAIWEAAGSSPRTGQFEPSVFMVGFDQATSDAFGTFERPDGSRITGDDLQPGQVIISDHLAEGTGLEVGDTLVLAYTPPVDPVVPELHFWSGNLTGTSLDLPGIPAIPNPTAATHTVDVEPMATQLSAVVGFDPRVAPGLPPTTTFTATITDPDGTTAARGQGQGFVWLNVTAPATSSLQTGTWTVTVEADASARTAYGAVGLVSYPVYDLAKLQQRANALQQEYGDLADQLDALDPFSNRQEMSFEVAAVASAGRIDQFDFRHVAWMPLGTAQEAYGREGQVNYIGISNPGGIESGVAGTPAAMRAINATLFDVQSRYPDAPALQALAAQDEKRQYLKVADDAGETMTSLLIFAGSLSIITGLLLILNIFTMLAEERRSELGMARAVGLGRRDLMRLFQYEGAVYAVAAASLGAIAGLGLAYVMILVMNLIIGQLGAGLSIPPVTFRPSAGAVLSAFGVGALLTFATIAVASRRQSNLNIVRAIRRIEEPDRSGSMAMALGVGLPLLVLGGIAAGLGWVPMWRFTGQFSLQVFGPLVAFVGLGVALRPVLRRRHLYPLLATVIVAYYTTTMFLITDFANLREANIVGPLRGVLITLAVVVLLVYFERGTRWLGHVLARWKPLRAVALPAVSYPLHKKFRTGMTLSMFAVVILSIGFFSIFGGLFDVDPDRQTGGYDIEARTTLSISDLDAYDAGLVPDGVIANTDRLRDFISQNPDFITVNGGGVGRFSDFQHHVYGFDEAFAQKAPFRLLWRDAGYASDADAYQAVLDGDGIIVSYLYSTDEQNRDLSYEVGDTLSLNLGNSSLNYTILGIQEQFHFGGIFLPESLVQGLFPTTEDLYLFNVAPGESPAETAKLLERNYQAVGLDADASRDAVLEEQESFRQILSAMKLFLALGLIVGVLSLGIITSRSVLERRQEIGMLRALGFTGKQVRSIFFVEVTYTLMLGALAGVACAVLVTYGLWYAVVRELQYPYTIPWGEIGLLVLGSYVVALLATMAPIRRSARVAPAEALRYLE